MRAEVVRQRLRFALANHMESWACRFQRGSNRPSRWMLTYG
jgi:hypothetical protein